MSELKPCPFCGGEAKLAGPDNPAAEYWVYHKECSSGPSSTNRERAITAWNTRAALSQPSVSVDEIENFLQRQRWEAAMSIVCKGEEATTRNIDRKAAQAFLARYNVTVKG